MLYSKNAKEFYRNCRKDVKKLLSKYSRSFVYTAYEAEELEQGFYFMLLNRDVLESFDSTVTNIDKVFTSYMCVHIKCYCREEKRRLRKERALKSKHDTVVESAAGKRMCIFEASQYPWAPGSRSGARFSTECGHAPLTEVNGSTYERLVADLCEALVADPSMEHTEREALLALVRRGSCGTSAGELADQLNCRPAKISGLRKQARERYGMYRELGYV